MAINVVTSQGLAEFTATGKTEDPIKPPEKAVEPVKVEEPVTKTDPPEDEEGLESDDKELTEKIRRKISRKHRAMREAEEFAEGQYNERRLAEARAQKLEQEIAELKSRVALPEAKEDPEPDKAKFEDAEKY